MKEIYKNSNEMPKNCIECEFCTKQKNCYLLQKSIDVESINRRYDCPIIDIKHLIDFHNEKLKAFLNLHYQFFELATLRNATFDECIKKALYNMDEIKKRQRN